MAAHDQLEIINAQGEIRFHSLNGNGITNIGRHPDNDIVVDSPVVAPFHAVLDHQQKPYRLIALNVDGAIKVSGQLLQPNTPKELRNWDTIELDGHSLILMEGGAASAAAAPSIVPTPFPIPIPPLAPAGPTSPTSDSSIPNNFPDLDELDRLLSSLPEDRSDDVIIVEPLAQNGAIDPNHPSALDFQVDVEQPATLQINVTNAGDWVGEFICDVRGLDPSWVAISPPSINLNEGERGSFSIAITAPRLPTSRAKAYYFSVVVTSPNYPGRMNSMGGLMALKPFYAYSVGDIDPRKQKVSYSKRVGQATIPITNVGNSLAAFNLTGEDERHAATIEFDSPEEGLKLVGQVQIKVPPEETHAVPIFITPRKRRLVAFGGEDIQYTVTVAPQAGDQPTPRSVLAQAYSQPFMGPIPIFLFALLLLLLAVWVFTPRVTEFTADQTEITSGDEVVLRWQAWPFVGLKLAPAIGKVEGPAGNRTVAPLEDTTYILTGETFLTWLLPQWFTATQEVKVRVDPLLPEIRLFEANKSTMNAGDEVIISWDVLRATSLILSIDGSDETILADQYISSRTFKLERDTIFTLRAANRYVLEGIQQSVTVRTQVPSPTPLPEPIIQQFDVLPLAITAGEEVTLTWDVKNVSKVIIEGAEGELPPAGTLTVRPLTNTAYVLKASNGQVERQSIVQQVIVAPPPPATPVPGTPKIDFFLANPVEVAIGSPESRNIRLTWQVSGDTTAVEITGPNNAKFSGLPKSGSLPIVTDKATLYVLTAFNGPNLRTSATAQLKVRNPAPKITSLSPSSSSNVGGGGFVLTVTGSGFTKDSKVQWAGANHTTVFVSESQLTASILAEDLVKAGSFEVKVFNSSPGGGTSGGVAFTLNNPIPTLASLSPASVTKGSPSITLTVNGTNFVSGSVVRFLGADAPTTFVSSTELTAQITPGQLASAGTPLVVVFNPAPGGGTSDSRVFRIDLSNPVPKINLQADPVPGLSTYIATAGGGDFPLTVNGANFIQGSLIAWKSSFLPTTYISDTRLTAIVPAAKLASSGTVKIRVSNLGPGGGLSNSVDFTVQVLTVTVDSVPVSEPVSVRLNGPLVSANPRMRVTIPVAQAAITTVTLTTDVATRISIHPYNTTTSTCTIGTPLPTLDIAIGSTSADFCIDGLSAGVATLTASLPASLGGDTDNQTVAVTGNAPIITSLESPINVPLVNVGVGSGSFTLTIRGANFSVIPKAQVRFSAGATVVTLPALIATASTLTVNVPDSVLGTVQPVTILVINADGADSTLTPAQFNVSAPTLATIAPTTKISGELGFTLTLNGANFVSGSTVQFNGTNIIPSFINSTQLTANVAASNIQGTAPATYNVTVTNPGGSVTTAQSFTLTQPTLSLSPPPTVSTTVGANTLFTITITPVQSVARTITLSGAGSLNLLASDCLSPLTLIIPASTASATFCGVGSAVSSGPETLTATLSGFTATATTAVTVNAAPANLRLTRSPSIGVVTGEPILFTAYVTSTGGTPTGTVTFTDTTTSATLCAAVTLVGSPPAATCNTSLNFAGAATHTISAAFTSTNPSIANGSISTSATVAKANTNIPVFTISSTTVVYGQTPTITANLDVTGPGNGTPTGILELKEGATVLNSTVLGASLDGIIISPTSPLDAGTHSLYANYPGDPNFNGSQSSPANLVVNPASVTVSISSSTNPSVYGQTVTFTINVTTNAPGSGTPTGEITLRFNGTAVAGCNPATLSGGSATCAMPGTPNVGNYPVVVDYNNLDGNWNDLNNTSMAGGQTVNAVTTSTNVTSSDGDNATIFGQSFTLTAVVTNTNSTGQTPTGTVTFTSSVNGNITGCINVAAASTTTNTATYTCAVCDQLTASNAGTAHNLAATYTSSSTNFLNSTDPSPITHTVTNPTISLSTCPAASASGSSTVSLTVTITAAQSSNTVITLASSDSNRVVAPANVTITSGNTTANFSVTEGTTVNSTANVTGTLPAGLGSGPTGACAVTFTP